MVAGIGFILILDVVVRQKFSGTKWSLPSHVYSRALELYEGLSLSQSQLVWELDQLGYRSVQNPALPGQYRASGREVVIKTRPFQFWDGAEPSRHLRLRFSGEQLRSVRADNGKHAALVRLEPMRIGGIYPDHREDREPVTLEKVPPYLVESLIAVEDRQFYRHHGVSLRGIGRALLGNVRSGAVTQGGSTLTQQLVKNFYLTQERTLVRKGMEVIMAVLLELHYSKGEILEAYINEIYLGQSGRRAIHGFGLASRHYFRQPLGELELHQVALLVALAKGASYYDPRRHPERALQRRNLVLRVLEQQQVVSVEEAARARAKPLGVTASPGTRSNPFPAYVDLVKRQLRQDYDERDLQTEGLRIFTGFDPQAQKKLEDTAQRELRRLEQQYAIPDGTLQTAAVVVRVGTGDVIALAGSRRQGFPGFNRALDARRPVGSTIKPAVYLTALRQPDRYTLSSPIDDGPIRINTEQQTVWAPRNFDRKDHGIVPLYQALGHSYNQATARLGVELGIEHVAQTVRDLGYLRPLPEVPALTLGAVNMSPLEVATLYHTIASDGYYTPLGGIESVYTSENQPLRRYAFEIEERVSPAAIHLLHYGLQVAMREGTGRSAYKILSPETVLAGKTGTSNGQRDSWFAGFSGNYLAVVWIGRDDNKKMPITGSSGALKLWAHLMRNLGAESFAYVQPENIDYHWVDPVSGGLSGDHCAGARYLPYIKGSAPRHNASCAPRSRDNVVDWLRDILRW